MQAQRKSREAEGSSLEEASTARANFLKRTSVAGHRCPSEESLVHNGQTTGVSLTPTLPGPVFVMAPTRKLKHRLCPRYGPATAKGPQGWMGSFSFSQPLCLPYHGMDLNQILHR